jgi:hypothetical protein
MPLQRSRSGHFIWLLVLLFPIPFSPWSLTIICLAAFCLFAYVLPSRANISKLAGFRPKSRLPVMYERVAVPTKPFGLNADSQDSSASVLERAGIDRYRTL